MSDEIVVSGVKSVAKATDQKSVTTLGIIKNYVSSDEIKKRFSEVLGKKAPTFLGSIVSLVSSNTNFNGVDPNTVMSSALVAATMDLPINPNLGFAHIIPYGGKAQFQMGYKGFVQLALRTGQYQTINATEIYEGELVRRNRLTGEVVIDEDKRTGETVIGYASFFKLLNGFEKTLYMTLDEVKAHGKKYSKSFNNSNAPWKTDFDGMAKKTVIKLLLSKFGILSVEMQRALEVDQAVLKNDGKEIEYVDTDGPIRVNDAPIIAESATMVSKNVPATAEVKIQSAPVEKGAITPAAEMQNEVHDQPREQLKHQSDQDLLDEMMESIKELSGKGEIAGWKQHYNSKLDKLKPMFQNMVINALSEKEAELNRPASDKKSRYQQFADFLESARTKKEVSSQVKAITQAENDGEISKDERVDLLEKLNAKLLELK